MEVDIAPQFGAELKVLDTPSSAAEPQLTLIILKDGYKNVNAWVRLSGF